MRKKAFLEISGKYRRRLQRQLGRNWAKAEAEDLTSQTMVILIENILDGRFQGKSSISTYLEAILRNLQRKIWASRQMDEQNLAEWNHRENEPDPEMWFIEQEKQQKITSLLAKLGEKCQEILQLWMLRYRMKEIAARMSYANDSVARNTKKRCMQALVQLIEKNPEIKQMLNELL